MPDTEYLKDLLIILSAALLSVPLCERLRLGSIIGFLCAGVLIGPHMFALVEAVEASRGIAELGVVFLLFTIGLELTLERLKLIGLRVYFYAAAQFFITSLIFGLLLLNFLDKPNISFLIGGCLALSSTVVVLQLLEEKGHMKTKFGQVALAVLLFQDLMVGPLLVLGEAFSAESEHSVAFLLFLALGKSVLAIIIIVAVGRVILRPLFRVVAATGKPEMLMALALLVALGTSWGTEQAHLSMAFGAFLAGLVLAETEYRHQVAADIEPFRGLLLGLFFISVGMSVNLQIALENAVTIILLAFAIMFVKTAVIIAISLAFKESVWRGLRLGVLLSQGSEFGFVLIGPVAAMGLLEQETGQILLVAIALTLAVTPLALGVGAGAMRFFEKQEVKSQHHIEQAGLAETSDNPHKADGPKIEKKHILLVGYNDVGRIVARMLRAQGRDYVILETSPRLVKLGREAGEPIFYGDARLEKVLRHAGAASAQCIIVATSSSDIALSVQGAVGTGGFAVPVIARSPNEETVSSLRRAGLSEVVPESTEIGLRLFGMAVYGHEEKR